jgi:predicted nuclease of restriction endonuclease-like (RecB) superfamily
MKAAVRFRINQKIKFLFIKKQNRIDHDQQHYYHHVPTVNRRLLLLLQLIDS